MNAAARRTSRWVRGLATVAFAVALTAGCGGQQIAEQLGEQAIDGNVEIDDDSLTITDDEGNEFAAGTGTQIPESWPADVPLYPSGELILATSQADGAATALWETQTPVDLAVAEYDSLLVSGGFALEQEAQIAGSVVRSYSNDAHTVTVTVAVVDGATNVNTTVVPR